MKRLDRASIEKFGTPSLFLMEHAGRAVADAALFWLLAAKKDLSKMRVAICCGKGNNGGDGIVCARYLLAFDVKVDLFIFSEQGLLKGDPLINLRILRSFNQESTFVNARNLEGVLPALDGADLIIDSIFGIGFSGSVTGYLKDLICCINSSKAAVISVDVPSGLNAKSGEIETVCVKADQTIAMGFLKTGFYRKFGPANCGRITVVDIGLAKEEVKRIGC